VLGGGITGLTTAYYLRQTLPADTRITVYEASDRFGGWIQSVNVPVKDSSTGQKIRFDTGPRILKSLDKDMTRFDDLVLRDMVCAP